MAVVVTSWNGSRRFSAMPHCVDDAIVPWMKQVVAEKWHSYYFDFALLAAIGTLDRSCCAQLGMGAVAGLHCCTAIKLQLVPQTQQVVVVKCPSYVNFDFVAFGLLDFWFRLCWGSASELYLTGDCALLIVNFSLVTQVALALH